MVLAERIKNLLADKPYLSRSAVAHRLGVSPAVVSTVAHRHNIKFMTRSEVEEWLDG